MGAMKVLLTPQYLFLASLAISVAGTCIALGGLASMQAYCAQNGGVRSGFEKSYQTKVGLTFESCAKQWRFEWFGWALQVTFLTIVGVCWWTGNVHNFKSALWTLAATCISLGMVYADYLVTLYDHTVGDLHLRGVVTFIGYTGFCAGDFLMMFTGEALYNQRRAEGLWRGMSLLKEAHNGKSNKLEGVTVA